MTNNIVNDVLGATTLRGKTTLEAGANDARNYLPLEVIQPTIRQSNIGTFTKCMRMFLLKERFGLVPSGYAPSAAIGTWFHLAHQARQSGRDEASINRILSGALSDMQTVLAGWAAESGNPNRASDLLANMEKDAALARIMSFLHNQKFPLIAPRCWVCGREGCEGLSIAATEAEYTAKIEGVPTPIGGRIDAVLRHVGGGIDGLIVLDHKTTGLKLSEWIECKGFATQPRLYRLLVMSQPQFTGERVIGFAYNLVRRPTCKWKANQDFEAYTQECKDWYESKIDVVGAPRLSTSKKGGYILGDDGQPKMYPRWDWSENADEFRVDPPMRRYFALYDEPPLTPEFENKLLLASKACTATPNLDSFMRTGEDSAGCKFYNRRCAYRDFCCTPPEQWQAVYERGWTNRELTLDSSDLADYE